MPYQWLLGDKRLQLVKISWDILPNYSPPRYETVGNPQYGSFITLFWMVEPQLGNITQLLIINPNV